MNCELPGLTQALILVYLHVNPFCAVKLRETSLLVHQKQLNYQLHIKILAYQVGFVEEKHIFRNKHLFTFWPVEVVSLRRTDQTNIVKGNDFFKQSHTFASYFWWHFIVPAKATCQSSCMAIFALMKTAAPAPIGSKIPAILWRIWRFESEDWLSQ